MKKMNIFNRNINSPSYRRMPVSGGFNRGGGIPLFSGMTAVIFALFIATPSFAEPTELDKKTVASKAYVDTKQDIIETGNVMFYDDPEGTEGDMYVPGLVAYDPQTSALSGNKIGILDMQTIWDNEGNLSLYSDSGGGYGSEMDNFVPTVRAVAEALQSIWDNMPTLTWNNTQSTAINAYNSTFGNGTNQWAGDSSHLINGYFLANSLALKQNKIETGLVNYYSMADDETKQVPSLVSYDSTNGLVGNEIGILDWFNTDNDGFWDLTGSAMDNFVPTVRAVAGVIQRLNWNTNNINAINAYSTAFNGTVGNWSGDDLGKLVNGYFLANSLALKQNRITTGLVEFNDNPEYMLPAITTYDSTSGLVANKIGILDQETIENDEGNLLVYSYANGYGSEMDNFVPTVRAVAEGLERKQNILPAAWTGTTNYYNVASTGGLTIELGANAGIVGRRYITAGGSQPLTQKAGADNVILYINGTKTLAQYQTSNFGAPSGDFATTNQNYIKGALVSLELLKDVYSALHNEIQNATPTGTPGNVAMYDASTGALGDGVATYSGATAQNPYNATNDAAKIATAAAVETKQTKRVCAGYEPGHENDPDYCWLWDFPD